MAHYALLDENNNVVSIITGRNENEIVSGITDWEQHYSEVTGFNVKRTSYNTYSNEHTNNGVPFRKNYAIVGGVYDEEKDAFYAQQPYPSWILNEQTFQWDSPIPYHDDDKGYNWNETTQEWIERN